jgi:hypothetical protein
VQEAELRLAECCKNVQLIFDIFQSIFVDTVVQEPGLACHEEGVKNSVDWTRSHTVSADVAVEALIKSTKLVYT